MSVFKILPWSYDSPEFAQLVEILDNELADLYPDWSLLPHPGAELGLENNEISPGNAKPQILNSLNAIESHVNSDEHADDDNNDRPSSACFIAFASHPDNSDQTLLSPVGCIAVKTMPFYPSHHPASTYPEARRPTVEQMIANHADKRTAQLKRFCVIKSHRSRAFTPSIAEALVRHLENYARQDMGVDRLVLETGIRQLGAIKLYKRLGWKRIENYGDYVSSREEVGGVSICYEKMLDMSSQSGLTNA